MCIRKENYCFKEDQWKILQNPGWDLLKINVVDRLHQLAPVYLIIKDLKASFNFNTCINLQVLYLTDMY